MIGCSFQGCVCGLALAGKARFETGQTAGRWGALAQLMHVPSLICERPCRLAGLDRTLAGRRSRHPRPRRFYTRKIPPRRGHNQTLLVRQFACPPCIPKSRRPYQAIPHWDVERRQRRRDDGRVGPDRGGAVSSLATASYHSIFATLSRMAPSSWQHLDRGMKHGRLTVVAGAISRQGVKQAPSWPDSVPLAYWR